MTFKSMLLFKSKSGSRRLASKSPVEQVTVCKVAAPTELVHEWTNESSAETRDEPNPVRSVAPKPVESFVTSAISEATDMVNYVKTIVLMDVSERNGKGKASAVQPASKIVNVKGSPFTLTKLIKTLDKQEREVEKLHKQLEEAEQKVMGAKKEQKMKKLQQQLNNAEQKVMDTRSRMKALADKFELRGILNDECDECDKGDKGFDERLKKVLADGINAVSVAGEEVLYFTKQLMSTIEESARQALPPDKTESQTEYGTEYGTESQTEYGTESQTEYGTEYGTESQTEYGTEYGTKSQNQSKDQSESENQSENQSENCVKDISKEECEEGVNPKRLFISVLVEASDEMFNDADENKREE
jgi:hypothetical protein